MRERTLSDQTGDSSYEAIRFIEKRSQLAVAEAVAYADQLRPLIEAQTRLAANEASAVADQRCMIAEAQVRDAIEVFERRHHDTLVGVKNHIPAFMNAIATVVALAHDLKTTSADLASCQRRLADVEAEMSGLRTKCPACEAQYGSGNNGLHSSV